MSSSELIYMSMKEPDLKINSELDNKKICSLPYL